MKKIAGRGFQESFHSVPNSIRNLCRAASTSIRIHEDEITVTRITTLKTTFMQHNSNKFWNFFQRQILCPSPLVRIIVADQKLLPSRYTNCAYSKLEPVFRSLTESTANGKIPNDNRGTLIWLEIRKGILGAEYVEKNLAMLGALGQMHEWEVHCRGALNNGVSKDEIRAIVHVVAIYCGVPMGLECFRVARRVLEEHEQL